MTSTDLTTTTDRRSAAPMTDRELGDLWSRANAALAAGDEAAREMRDLAARLLAARQS